MIEPEHLRTLSREDLLGLVAELQRQIAALTASNEALRAEIDQLKTVWDTFRGLDAKKLVDDERVWRELQDRFGEYFTGGMGAGAKWWTRSMCSEPASRAVSMALRAGNAGR